MSRLTTRMSIMGRKHDIEGGQAYHWKEKLKGYDYSLIEEVVDKLGDLEDIEEEMGCPIEVLFKAMKQGLFYKGYSGDIKEFMPDGSQFIAPDLPNEGLLLLHVSAYEDCIIIEKGLALNGYGTEWALTKEELQ